MMMSGDFKKQALRAAVLLSLAGIAMPGQAYDTYTVSALGRDMFTLYVMNEGEQSVISPPSVYTLDKSMIQGILASTQRWADMLAYGAVNTSTQPIIIYTKSDINAAASTTSYTNGKRTNIDYMAKRIQNDKQLKSFDVIDANGADLSQGDWSISDIFVGQNSTTGTYGFSASYDSIVPENLGSLNISPVLYHEMAHALGMYSRVDNDWKFQDDATDSLSFTAHLMDINGNFAKQGMQIISTSDFSTLQASDPTVKASDYFIMNDTKDTENYNTRGYAFFVGNHVLDVLNGATYKGVSGIPINGFEDGYPEISHIILSRLLMSHNLYRSYNIFTEIELAAMQDMGYQLDRRNYFGYSVYGDGSDITNYNGYWARNAEGTAFLQGEYNTTSLGVGLHIYGNHNQVVQAADIKTSGTGSIGMLLDGVGNVLSLASSATVNADGSNGDGIAVLYGMDNVVNQYGTVTANGDRGTGVRFDFGTNAARIDQYRGSYLRYLLTVKDKKITAVENTDLVSDITGPLVSSYNLYGSLSGKANAIYIAPNALVNEININNGASISGNITSEWKHFQTDNGWFEPRADIAAGNKNEGLAIQYNGAKIPYAYYIPDLVTKLNVDADMAYSGTITGTDNMKLNVKGHTLTYTGAANVVNVQVDSGATLLGGTYTVNDMTSIMAPGYSDSTTGKFINNGTIGALTPSSSDTSMSITGNLEQNGTVQFTANNKNLGYIDVSGDISNSASAALQIDANGIYRPSYAYTANIVRKGGQGAGLVYSQMNPYSTGLLTAVYDPSASTVTFTPASKLAGGTTNQNQALDAINSMYAQGDETTQSNLLGIYNAKGSNAGKALSEVSGEDKNGATMANILRTPIHHAVLARMHELQETYGHGGMGPGAKPELTTLDNSIWARLSKGWGELNNNDASYNTFDMTIGYDKAHGNYWRHGVLADYGTVTFAGTDSHAETKDWRIGVYSTYENGRNHGFIYADYGWQDNDFYRTMSLLGRRASGKYDSHIIEIGGEYKRDLYRAGTHAWQISPYVDLQAVHYKQDGYSESGADVYNQTANGMNETYTAGTVGVEFSCADDHGGSVAFRAGYKKAFSGTNPKLQYRLEGAQSGNTYTTATEQDKNFLVLSMSAEKQYNPHWSLKGDVGMERGSHDKQVDASVTVKYRF